MLSLLFSLDGRVRRRDYVFFNLTLLILICVMMAPELARLPDVMALPHIITIGYDDFYVYLGRLLDRFMRPFHNGPDWLVMTIGYAGFVTLAWIRFALAIKRWHDRDKSGFWMLIELVPVVGIIWSFVETILLDGTLGTNTYGSDPKAKHSPIQTTASITAHLT